MATIIVNSSGHALEACIIGEEQDLLAGGGYAFSLDVMRLHESALAILILCHVLVAHDSASRIALALFAVLVEVHSPVRSFVSGGRGRHFVNVVADQSFSGVCCARDGITIIMTATAGVVICISRCLWSLRPAKGVMTIDTSPFPHLRSSKGSVFQYIARS